MQHQYNNFMPVRQRIRSACVQTTGEFGLAAREHYEREKVRERESVGGGLSCRQLSHMLIIQAITGSQGKNIQSSDDDY